MAYGEHKNGKDTVFKEPEVAFKLAATHITIYDSVCRDIEMEKILVDVVEEKGKEYPAISMLLETGSVIYIVFIQSENKVIARVTYASSMDKAISKNYMFGEWIFKIKQ
jgi:hypothetical protein